MKAMDRNDEDLSSRAAFIATNDTMAGNIIDPLLQHRIFSHPDYTVGFGFAPNQRCCRYLAPYWQRGSRAHALIAFTAGRELAGFD